MTQQTTFKEIPEIKAYKELKIQIEAGQRKLTETETKLTNMKSSINELEGKISESELNKQKNAFVIIVMPKLRRANSFAQIVEVL